MSSQRPEILSIGELFQSRYIVPIYQRAYAWSTAEIETLLADVRDACSAKRSEYFLGSLVVDRKEVLGEIVFEVVDGQQRLTTLFILLCVTGGLPHSSERPALQFEGRPTTDELLQRLEPALAPQGLLKESGPIPDAAALMSAAWVANQNARGVAPEGVVFTPTHREYLLDNVKLVRSELPPRTDLNHYFEIMNTRGVQLEKHEILKARLMSDLPDDQRAAFAQIWDACSVMDNNVQLGFLPQERDRIFGSEWKTLALNQDELLSTPRPVPDEQTETAPPETSLGSDARNARTLADVLTEGTQQAMSEERSEEPGTRYRPIIDFPNFLLQVLKVMRDEEHEWGHQSNQGVRLEDRELLTQFEQYLDSTDAAEARRFIWYLLRCRLLLDSYVIRSALTNGGNDDENWVLLRAVKRTKQSDEGDKRQLGVLAVFNEETRRQVLLLQSMFQVSDPRRASKHFLFHILKWLFKQPAEVDGGKFAAMLERLAAQRARLTTSSEATDQGKDVLDKGVDVPNFIFNYLDYCLARLPETKQVDSITQLAGVSQGDQIINAMRSFGFRYRTSVEHFYPQHPDTGQDHQYLSEVELNRFGNLCIMSRSENSRRSNLMPTAKIEQFASRQQSLKFQVMAAVTRDGLRNKKEGELPWGATEIEAHGLKMRELLDISIEEHLASRDQALPKSH